MNQTDWTPGLITLGAGLAIGIFFFLMQRKRVAPTEGEGSSALDAKYQALLTQLKEHSAAKHLATPDAWAAEQSRLEQAAAAVLREKANVGHEALKAEARAQKLAEAPKGFFGKNPAIAGAIWGGGAVAFFAFLGMTLSTESKPRVEDGPMGPMGGGQVVKPGEAPQEPPMDPKLQAALSFAEREPDNVEALAGAASELMKRQMFEDAQPLVMRATLIDPYHVRIRIFRTVLDKALNGPPMVAMAELEHLADTYEDAWPARLYAGALAAQTGQPARALKHFERFLDEAPNSEHPPMIRRGIEELRAQVAASPTPPPGSIPPQP
jgi:tetratricopeptide (TPR) repeat protein